MALTTEQLASVALSLRAIAGALGEYERQRGQGAKPDSYSLISTLTREATRLHVNGQVALASALQGLRLDLEALHNG